VKILTVHHATTYRYAEPVRFGEHRLMMRPRDSHDLRLLRSELTLSPPGSIRWMHDVFGNSVAIVDFADGAAELKIVSLLMLERYGLERTVFPIAPISAVSPSSTIRIPRRWSQPGRTSSCRKRASIRCNC
jgi:hypothetical protein